MLFEQQLTAKDTSLGFVDLQTLAERFAQNPDPVLDEMGGSRVDIAIGIGRTVYQLKVRQTAGHAQVQVNWLKADTTARRLKESAACVALQAVPVTLDSAVKSLAQAFDLSEQEVWKEGVDLLAYWQEAQAHDRLELPMSREWHRHSLANRQGLQSPAI